MLGGGGHSPLTGVREPCGCSPGPSTVPVPGPVGAQGEGVASMCHRVAGPVQTTVGVLRPEDAAVKSAKEVGLSVTEE